MKKPFCEFLLILPFLVPVATSPEYSIQAIRYASADGEVASLVRGAPKGEKISIAMVVWLIRGGGRNILFDSGYHRDTFLKYFPATEYIPPDEAVKLAGVAPGEVTDIVISHAHWDHLGGIDLFPKATVWIQREEFRYYTGDAWQPGGNHGGIDPEDVRQLVKLNTEGRVHLVDGDNVEIFPGIRAYTGARHTFASQYLRVDGDPPFVLASDNCYLYRNLAEHKASATFSEADLAANLKNQARMIELAGSADRVVPGHDMLQFQKFPTEGRIAKIR
ncbi:MAG TPA: N-acyl homoserine lactonase family protein [Candidatus Acidoferrum sp.]|jgi:glyoxylase-like metal-dependent hydrolase (beta-lactamase superfamily II)|nr:N-acyl homoserine lactonase family protein [Candidatus Acidoferrum sp.]